MLNALCGWSDGSRADILAIFNTIFPIPSMFIAAIIKMCFPIWWQEAGLFGFSLVTAYYGALRQAHFTRADQPVNIRPEAWSVEAGYTTELFSKKTYGALMYSQTADLVGAFPEARSIATLGTWFSNNIRLALEYVYDQDYPKTAPAQGGPGGTGRTSETYLIRLTYEW